MNEGGLERLDIFNHCDYHVTTLSLPSQQLKSKCPCLSEVVGSFVDILEDNPDKLSRRDVTLYFENLLTFFFSPLSSELNDNDVMWFLGYLNTLTSVDVSQAVIQVHQDVDLALRVEGEGPVPEKDQSPLLNALSTGMAKRVLGEILTHLQEDEMPFPPLSIFCRKVWYLNFMVT